MEERVALESEIIRKCLSRSELQCSFLEYRGHKVIYRRYASLFFIVGTKPDVGQEENNENELGMLEFIHALVETMDRWVVVYRIGFDYRWRLHDVSVSRLPEEVYTNSLYLILLYLIF